MTETERQKLFNNSSVAERTALAKEFCRRDFAAFFKLCFTILNPGTELAWNWHLDYFCWLAMRCLPIDEKKLNPEPDKPRIRRLIINVPPRSTKSELFNIAFSVFILSHYPHERIIAASVTDRLTKDLAMKVIRIMKDKRYQEIFPEIILEKDSLEKIIVKNFNGERTATSAQTAIIGQGGNYIVMDDMQTVSQGHQESGQDIETVNNMVTNTLLGRVNNFKIAVFICIMQRIGPTDLTAHLLKQNETLPESEKWIHIVLPEVNNETRTFDFYGRKFEWKEGEPLDAERRPHSVIKTKRDSTPAWDWATQYLQNPVPLVGGIIPMKDFRRFILDEVLAGSRGVPKMIYQSWDTGNKDKKDNCPSVCGTWWEFDDGIYLVDIRRGKWQFDPLCREVVGCFLRWKPHTIIVEDKASGTQVLQHFRDIETIRRLPLIYGADHPPPMVAFDPKPYGDKFLRMQRKTTLITTGRVHLPNTAPWLSDFEQECLFFPKGQKDQVDQMSQMLTYWTECSASRYWIDSL